MSAANFARRFTRIDGVLEKNFLIKDVVIACLIAHVLVIEI